MPLLRHLNVIHMLLLPCMVGETLPTLPPLWLDLDGSRPLSWEWWDMGGSQPLVLLGDAVLPIMWGLMPGTMHELLVAIHLQAHRLETIVGLKSVKNSPSGKI